MAAGDQNGELGRTTILLHGCVDGSRQARNELHEHIFLRVRAMSRKECAKFRQFTTMFDADDVQQEVQTRLDRVLQSNPPPGSPQLWKLVSMIIPQVLIDQYRKSACRPAVQENEMLARISTDGPVAALDRGTSGDDPRRLAEWTEFHQKALDLPDPHGVVFRMIWYKLVPRQEIADLLKVTVRTISNYYQQALEELRPYMPC
jgi:RNA polymerase sigma factor (sigma-70 family)